MPEETTPIHDASQNGPLHKAEGDKKKGRKGKRNVIFIGDRYRKRIALNKETSHPIIDTIDELIDKHGDKFNIYVQSVEELDQRKMPKAVQKAVVDVQTGDVHMGLLKIQEKYPTVFKDKNLMIMSVDKGCWKGGQEEFKTWCKGIKLHVIQEREEQKFALPPEVAD